MIRNSIDNLNLVGYDLGLQEEPRVYVCLCHGITEKQINSCVEDGARTFSDLQGQLGVATQCGSCAHQACEILDESLRQSQCAGPNRHRAAIPLQAHP
jgi:bacterioferritin-associated ferredoxin